MGFKDDDVRIDRADTQSRINVGGGGDMSFCMSKMK